MYRSSALSCGLTPSMSLQGTRAGASRIPPRVHHFSSSAADTFRAAAMRSRTLSLGS
jgi:hypothetical protein